MFVNSVSMCPIAYRRNNTQAQHPITKPILRANYADTVSFSALSIKPEIRKNQLKILLTQDIWATKLKVKMPESDLEKEVLLEILENRAKLDKFARLTNLKYSIKTKISVLNDLLETNPTSPKVAELRKELEKHGNITSTLKTIDKNIENESKRNKAALDYFKRIEELSDTYWENKLVKPNMMDKFLKQIEKNNINTDEKYSTRELIEIIKSGKLPDAVEPVQVTKATPILSKKQLIPEIAKQYEQILRETVDVYSGQYSHHADASFARKRVNEIFAESIQKYPEIQKQLSKTFASVEAKYMHKVNQLGGTDIYPIGEIWADMKRVATSMKQHAQELTKLKAELAQKPRSIKLRKAVAEKEALLREERADWLKGVQYSLKYETINQTRMKEAGKLSEYLYLTSENKTIKKHKEVLEIYNRNNQTIPEDMWNEILK